MTRQWWLGVLCVLTLVSVVLARPGSVKTKDGRTIDGDITDVPGDDTVSITIHGVQTSMQRSDIDSITYSNSLDQQYQDRLAKLAPTDVGGRIELARWAFENRQYELARQAVESAQKIDPTNSDAATLSETIKATMAMEAKRPGTVTPAVDNTTPPHVGPDAGGPAAPVATHYLSADDINTIRQMELQAADANARVQFLNKVKERYLSTGDKDAQKFNAMQPGAQAIELINTGDANLMKDVRIMSDPASLIEFRVKIQPRVLAGCAASGCHGGANAGSFLLYTNAVDQTNVWYTNFYILQKYTTKVSGGSGFGGGDVTRAMVDRTNPGSSLLLQFGLPANLALTPHPKTPGLKQVFMSDQDATYKLISHWLTGSLKQFVPDYPIKYDLPTGKSSTQPAATQPAPAP